jgi:branched-chain amino acid transport system permease protein
MTDGAVAGRRRLTRPDVLWRWGGRTVIALAIVLVPTVAQPYQLSLVTTALIASLGAMALSLVMGLAGLVTAGHAALLAVGAYGAAFAANTLELNFVLVLVGSAIVGAVVGLIVGLPALRVSGIYLAITTLALHFVVVFAFNRYQTNTVGSAGFFLPRPTFFGVRMDSYVKWYVLVVLFVVATWWIIENLKHSRIGRAWMLLRDSPLAAATQGVWPAAYKLLAFVLSSALVSVSGTLLAYFQRTVYIESFTLELGIQFIAMIIIGGMGSTGGAIAGAFFVTLLPTLLSQGIAQLPSGGRVVEFLQANLGDIQLIAYGALVVIFLIWRPDGLAGLVKRLTRRSAPAVVERSSTEDVSIESGTGRA